MRQVPSFRADPLTPTCDTWCEFPVSDRPNAVRQFFDAAAKDASLIQVTETLFDYSFFGFAAMTVMLHAVMLHRYGVGLSTLFCGCCRKQIAAHQVMRC